MKDDALCETIGHDTYPFNEREIVTVEGNGKVIPYALARLKTLTRANMKSTVVDIACSSKLGPAPLELELDLERTAVFDRVRTTIEILAQDSWEDIDASALQTAESAIIDHVTDSMLDSPSFSGSANYAASILIPHLMILLVRGKIEDVSKLLRMWKSLSFLATPGSRGSIQGSHLASHVTALKVLRTMSDFLNAFEIPTQKALSARTGLAENKLSIILDKLNFRGYVPPATWPKNKFRVGDVYQFGHACRVGREIYDELIRNYPGESKPVVLGPELDKYC